MLALKLKWLPTSDDSELSFAMAAWLEKKYWEDMSIAVANGTAKAFGGK